MIQRYSIIVAVWTILTFPAFPQDRVDINSLRSNYATEESRDKFISNLQSMTENTLNGALNPHTESRWKSLFRELELANHKSDKVYEVAEKSVKYALTSNASFQRATIELIYTLYPDDFYEDVFEIYTVTRNTQVFGAACFYLVNHYLNPLTHDKVREDLESRFPNYSSDPVLRFLHLDLSADRQSRYSALSLTELLAHPFQQGKTIIYSLHRKDRKHPGLTVIKKPDGKFLRNSDSTIFHVAQLAHSTSKLPGYLSQGDTPQGIFSVVGFYISPTESIGPTPNVLTRIPFEVSTEIFYHKEVENTRWRYDDYKNLLPANWQESPWIYESYFAGKSGRRLIVMHGSTDDVSFFEDEPYYPLTPSKGCMTTKELWSEESGKCIESDQAKLMNAFFSTGQLYGFLVVLNLDESSKPVSIEELQPLIEAAEKLLEESSN